jgi:hypothetical protein
LDDPPPPFGLIANQFLPGQPPEQPQSSPLCGFCFLSNRLSGFREANTTWQTWLAVCSSRFSVTLIYPPILRKKRVDKADASGNLSGLSKSVASVAQLVEQLTLNQLVLGSSPSRGTISHRARLPRGHGTILPCQGRVPIYIYKYIGQQCAFIHAPLDRPAPA